MIVQQFSPLTLIRTPVILQELDEQLGEVVEGVSGSIVAPRVLPAAIYRAVPWEEFRLWCHYRAFYGIPTTETIDWLRRYIKGRSAIEIGGASGVFGRALGIPSTDSFVQTDNEEAAVYYALSQQPVVSYGRDVEKLDAVQAVKKYRPQVVFGSWVTQYGLEGQGCMYGVREEQILARKHVKAYLVFGARASHRRKAIASQPPKGWRFRVETHPGFFSRAAGESVMFIWERK